MPSLESNRWIVTKSWRTFFPLAMMCVVAANAGCRNSEHGVSTSHVMLPDLAETYDDVAEAIRLHYNEVVANPNSGHAWGKYGMVLDAHEFHDACIPCYERAVQIQPEESKWAWLLASRIKETNPDQALRLLNRKFTDSKLPQPLLILQMTLMEESGKTEAADAILNQALTHNASNPYLIIQLARRHHEMRELQQARALLTNTEVGLALSRQYQDAAQLLARIAQSEGRPEEAATIMKQAESLPKSNITVDNPILTELAAMRRDPLWRGERAAVEARNGGALARSELENLVERFPEIIPNRINLVLFLLSQREYEKADACVRYGLLTSPDNERLLMTQVAVDLDRERWANAETTLKHLLTVNSGSGAGWSDLGFVLEQQSKRSDAIDAYENALRILPEDEQLHKRLAALRRMHKLHGK